MLAIARGMISKPKLLLLDEPSLGLAPLVVKSIFDVISDLRKKGMTVLLVEQNSNVALRVADRGYVMQTGSIIIEDTCENLLKNQQIQNLYLGRKVRQS
jgi:branched-chain amino acid transport system ATP-binding protein